MKSITSWWHTSSDIIPSVGDYQLTICWLSTPLSTDNQLAIGRLWAGYQSAGHGAQLWAGNQLSSGWLLAMYGLAIYQLSIGWPWDGLSNIYGLLSAIYWLAMAPNQYTLRQSYTNYDVLKLDMATSNTLNCSVFTRVLVFCWLWPEINKLRSCSKVAHGFKQYCAL